MNEKRHGLIDFSLIPILAIVVAVMGILLSVFTFFWVKIGWAVDTAWFKLSAMVFTIGGIYPSMRVVTNVLNCFVMRFIAPPLPIEEILEREASWRTPEPPRTHNQYCTVREFPCCIMVAGEEVRRKMKKARIDTSILRFPGHPLPPGVPI